MTNCAGCGDVVDCAENGKACREIGGKMDIWIVIWLWGGLLKQMCVYAEQDKARDVYNKWRTMADDPNDVWLIKRELRV